MEGILEDMFAGIEFIKWKGDSGLSVARVFEEKHGYGVLMRKDNFPRELSYCLSKVIEFVSDEITANVSRFLKTYTDTINLGRMLNKNNRMKKISIKLKKGGSKA